MDLGRLLNAKRGSGLVEANQFDMLTERPCNGDGLPLSTRE
jgi:hypothetical protein